MGWGTENDTEKLRGGTGKVWRLKYLVGGWQLWKEEVGDGG